MKIKNGGQVASLGSDKKIETIEIYHELGRRGSLLINGSSLSYLSLDELLDLKKEVNDTLQRIIQNFPED